MDQLSILSRIPDCAFLVVRILAPKQNLDHRSFVSLGSSKLFLFTNKAHLNSVVRLLLERYCVVAFFTICAKLLLTMAFTFTFLDVIAVSG